MRSAPLLSDGAGTDGLEMSKSEGRLISQSSFKAQVWNSKLTDDGVPGRRTSRSLFRHLDGRKR